MLGDRGVASAAPGWTRRAPRPGGGRRGRRRRPSFALIAVYLSILLVGVTMTAAIARQARDIALLRAVGATPGRIRRAVALQAAVVAVPAVLVGVPARACSPAAPGSHAWSITASCRRRSRSRPVPVAAARRSLGIAAGDLGRRRAGRGVRPARVRPAVALTETATPAAGRSAGVRIVARPPPGGRRRGAVGRRSPPCPPTQADDAGVLRHARALRRRRAARPGRCCGVTAPARPLLPWPAARGGWPPTTSARCPGRCPARWSRSCWRSRSPRQGGRRTPRRRTSPAPRRPGRGRLAGLLGHRRLLRCSPPSPRSTRWSPSCVGRRGDLALLAAGRRHPGAGAGRGGLRSWHRDRSPRCPRRPAWPRRTLAADRAHRPGHLAAVRAAGDAGRRRARPPRRVVAAGTVLPAALLTRRPADRGRGRDRDRPDPARAVRRRAPGGMLGVRAGRACCSPLPAFVLAAARPGGAAPLSLLGIGLPLLVGVLLLARQLASRGSGAPARRAARLGLAAAAAAGRAAVRSARARAVLGDGRAWRALVVLLRQGSRWPPSRRTSTPARSSLGWPLLTCPLWWLASPDRLRPSSRHVSWADTWLLGARSARPCCWSSRGCCAGWSPSTGCWPRAARPGPAGAADRPRSSQPGGADRRRRHHAAPAGTRPARRHPGPAGVARHDAGPDREAARPGRHRRSDALVGAGPRHASPTRSPSCARSSAASTRRRWTTGCRPRWARWPPAAGCRSRSTSTLGPTPPPDAATTLYFTRRRAAQQRRPARRRAPGCGCR